MRTAFGRGQRSEEFSRPYLCYLVLLLAVANALSYADRQLFAILAPAIKAEFDVSDAVIGLIGGPVFMLPFVFGSYPLARLADRWSRRKILAVSVSVWSIMTAACGLAQNATHLAMARVGVGIGEAGGSPPSQAVIASVFRPERRAMALAVFSSGMFLGLLTAMWGGAVLEQAIGWRSTFLALAVPGVLVAFLVWATTPRRSGGPATPAAVPALAVMKHCWQIPTFRLICLAAAMLGIFSYGISTFLPSYFMRSHGISLLETGFWIGVGGTAGGLLGTLTSGVLVDRLIRRDRRWQLLVPTIGTALAIPVFMWQLLIPSGMVIEFGPFAMPMAALPSPFSAFLGGIWMPPCFAATANLVPPAFRSQAAALLIIVLTAAGAGVGPLLVGALSDVLNPRFGEESLRYSLLITSLVVLFSVAAFWRAAAHYPRDLAQMRVEP